MALVTSVHVFWHCTPLCNISLYVWRRGILLYSQTLWEVMQFAVDSFVWDNMLHVLATFCCDYLNCCIQPLTILSHWKKNFRKSQGCKKIFWAEDWGQVLVIRPHHRTRLIGLLLQVSWRSVVYLRVCVCVSVSVGHDCEPWCKTAEQNKMPLDGADWCRPCIK